MPKARPPEPYTVMTFGKYKDDPVDEVPVWYLEWCIENMELTRQQKEAFENEILTREDED